MATKLIQDFSRCYGKFIAHPELESRQSNSEVFTVTTEESFFPLATYLILQNNTYWSRTTMLQKLNFLKELGQPSLQSDRKGNTNLVFL